MSEKQLKTFKVINRFIDKSITRQQAAELLGLSPRQITRLKKGALPLADFGISLSYSAISSVLKNAGFESPKKKKIRHRTHRHKRKLHPGQLIQIDATPFEWFGGNVKYALHGAIDDASGKIVGLFLTQNECLYGYLETMLQCCMDFGIPQTVYSDNHTIFRSPKAWKLSAGERISDKTVHLTQFGHSMHEPGIDLIFAKTPRTKGRIERLWTALQSRLPAEFAKRGSRTLSEANQFPEKEYRKLFNQRFSVTPEAESILFPLQKEGIWIPSYT